MVQRPDLGKPATWPEGFAEDNMRRITFALAAPDPKHPEQDQFLVLGDNSSSSKDSRLWRAADHINFWVARQALIGKALFIYWPHSWDKLPGLPVPCPFFPNFERMRLVR
jgi:signal peptidase I